MSDWGTFPTTWGAPTAVYLKPPLPKQDGGSGLPSGEWRMIANDRIWRLVVDDGDIDPATGPGSSSDRLQNVTYETVHGLRGDCFKVSFDRRVELKDQPEIYQQWVGYLFWSAGDSTGNELDPKYRLAGTYEQIETDGASHSGGWYATLDRDKVEQPKNRSFEFG